MELKNRTNISQIPSNLSYVITIQTQTINKSSINLSQLKSNYFQKKESYITQYLNPIDYNPIRNISNPCSNFTTPYCILQNYDNSDHIPFVLSISYPEDYVVYIDMDHLDIPISYLNSTLLDIVLPKLYRYDIDIFTCSCYKDKLIHGCLITRQSIIRRVLTTTTLVKGSLDVLDYIPILSKQSNRPFTYLSLVTFNYMYKPSLSLVNKNIPELFSCNDLYETEPSFTVIIPSFRRPKLKKLLTSIEKQNTQPKQIIILQSTNTINYEDDIFNSNKTSYYHIWFSNWNIRYYGKYYIGSIVDTNFIILNDDDYYVDQEDSYTYIISNITQSNSIYGSECGHYQIGFHNGSYPCDHASNVVYTRIKHIKLFLQNNLPTYDRYEDIEFSCSLKVICNVSTHILDIPFKIETSDKYASWKPANKEVDYQLLDYLRKQHPNEYPLKTYTDVYDWYIERGFIPYNYTIEQLGNKWNKNRIQNLTIV